MSLQEKWKKDSKTSVLLCPYIPNFCLPNVLRLFRNLYSLSSVDKIAGQVDRNVDNLSVFPIVQAVVVVWRVKFRRPANYESEQLGQFNYGRMAPHDTT